MSIPSNIQNSQLLGVSCRGLVGEIARWILKTSIKPQPELAVATSLAFVGALKGHRVQSETGLRTNLLLAGIAPSGSGKNHPIECVKRLLIDTNLESLCGGKPASDAGLSKMLHSSSGRLLILWDEMGQALRQLTDKSAIGYQREILSLMTELFTCASSFYKTKGYSDGSGRDVITIEQPHLCVYGTSTPERFYAAINSTLVEDGFIPRFLFVEVKDPFPKRRDSGGVQQPPQSIIDKIASTVAMSTNVEAGEYELPRYVKIVPATIPFTDEARRELLEVSTNFDSLIQEADSDLIRAIYNRAIEHIIKVALTVEDGPEITQYSIRWGIGFVCNCVSTLISRLGDTIVDSSHAQSTKKVLEVIKKYGEISHSDLLRKTQSLRHGERADILRLLIDSEQIVAKRVKDDSRKIKTVYLNNS